MNAISNRGGGDVEDLIPRDESEAPPSRLADLFASLREILRRRYLTLILIVVVALAVMLALIWQIAPKYESSARLRIDPSRSALTSPRESTGGLSDEAIDTEVTVLGSLDLAREVVKRLNLVNDPEFKPKGESRGVGPEEQLNSISQAVMAHLDVRREKLTYIIDVAFESSNPVKAAKIANGFAETYIATRIGGRTSTAESQVVFLTQQLEKLGAEVRLADARLAQYRASAGIVEGGTNGTITDQQVAPLSTQLASAESAAAEARAKLAQARQQVAAGGLDAVSDVRSSPVIADLRRQLAEVTRNLGEISARYGDRHPETIKVKQQVLALNSQIQDEANRTVGSLQAEANAASASAASLSGALRSLKSQQATNTNASVIASGFQRDAESKRAAYDRTAQMRQEALQSARNVISNAEIVDRAQTPPYPTAPNKRLLAAAAIVIAFMLGLGVITLQELLTPGMRSIADIEGQLKLALLASVPKVPGRKNRLSPADSLIDQPASVFAEALRNARASILGVRSTSGPRIVAFTSALPEEGKTTTALSFARILGMNGTKTLLVDCDLRKASLQALVEMRAEAGLVEVLHGDARLDDAIVSDRVDNLDLLLVNDRLFTAEDMFGDGKMPKLLEELKRRYKVIILDLPPVMGVADARALAVQADIAVMVVRWGSTPPRAAGSALSWLRGDGANVVGAIYTMVDPNSEAAGGLFYSSKYAAYYQKGA